MSEPELKTKAARSEVALRRRTPMGAAFLVSGILAGGCVASVDHSGTAYRCELTPECPSGLSCVDNQCVDPDAPPEADASPIDAPLPELDLAIPVALGTDDAEEDVATGVMNLASSDLELIHDGEDQTVGIRFAALSLAQGQRFNEAYIQFTTDEVSALPTDLVIYAQAIEDAPTFTDALNDISLRTKTVAQVTWSPPAWELVDESAAAQQTPNLAPLVQEVIAQPTWTSGNAIVFVIEGAGARVARSFNIDPLKAAVLIVH